MVPGKPSSVIRRDVLNCEDVVDGELDDDADVDVFAGDKA